MGGGVSCCSIPETTEPKQLHEEVRSSKSEPNLERKHHSVHKRSESFCYILDQLENIIRELPQHSLNPKHASGPTTIDVPETKLAVVAESSGRFHQVLGPGNHQIPSGYIVTGLLQLLDTSLSTETECEAPSRVAYLDPSMESEILIITDEMKKNVKKTLVEVSVEFVPPPYSPGSPLPVYMQRKMEKIAFMAESGLGHAIGSFTQSYLQKHRWEIVRSVMLALLPKFQKETFKFVITILNIEDVTDVPPDMVGQAIPAIRGFRERWAQRMLEQVEESTKTTKLDIAISSCETTRDEAVVDVRSENDDEFVNLWAEKATFDEEENKCLWDAVKDNPYGQSDHALDSSDWSGARRCSCQRIDY